MTKRCSGYETARISHDLLISARRLRAAGGKISNMDLLNFEKHVSRRGGEKISKLDYRTSTTSGAISNCVLSYQFEQGADAGRRDRPHIPLPGVPTRWKLVALAARIGLRAER